MSYTPSLRDIEEVSYQPSMGDAMSQQTQQPSMGSEHDLWYGKTSPDFSGLNRFSGNVLSGLATTGQNIANFPHKLMGQKPPQQIDFGREVFGIENPGLSDKLVQGLAEYAPLGAAGLESAVARSLPAMAGHPLARQLATQAGAGGIFGALENPDIAQGAALGAAGGAGGTALGRGLSMLPQGISRFFPQEYAKRTLLGGINPEEVMPRMEASRRLGLEFMTPGEAAGNPLITGLEGKTGITSEAAGMRYAGEKSRLGTEQQAIRNLYNDIYNPKELGKELSQKYQSLGNHVVPEQIMPIIKNDPLIQQAFKNVQKDVAYQKELSGIPENNFVYLDQVKRKLDAMHLRAMAGKSPDRNRARIIGDTRDNLINVMEKINPSYKEARNLAERKIVQEQLQKTMNKSQMRGSTFYNKFLKNPDTYENLLHKLRNAPEAQQKLQDMKTVFEDLMNVRTPRGGRVLAESGLETGRKASDLVKSAFKKAFMKKHDKAMIELMQNPKWDRELHSVAQSTKRSEKLTGMEQLLSKIGMISLNRSLMRQEEQ